MLRLCAGSLLVAGSLPRIISCTLVPVPVREDHVGEDHEQEISSRDSAGLSSSEDSNLVSAPTDFFEHYAARIYAGFRKQGVEELYLPDACLFFSTPPQFAPTPGNVNGMCGQEKILHAAEGAFPKGSVMTARGAEGEMLSAATGAGCRRRAAGQGDQFCAPDGHVEFHEIRTPLPSKACHRRQNFRPFWPYDVHNHFRQ